MAENGAHISLRLSSPENLIQGQLEERNMKEQRVVGSCYVFFILHMAEASSSFRVRPGTEETGNDGHCQRAGLHVN